MRGMSKDKCNQCDYSNNHIQYKFLKNLPSASAYRLVQIREIRGKKGNVCN
jgi:hypothetical protein